VRFAVVPAARRSGKTELSKRKIVKCAMNCPGKRFFFGAPTRAQAKAIAWEDLKLLSFAPLYGRRAVHTSELTIHLPNRASIVVLGLDEPARFEGQTYGGGVIDEIGNVKASAWPENVAPALDTVDPRDPDYLAWCWLIGVPEGLNHYYDIAEYARTANDPDWGFYTWPSRDILPPEVIEAAKRRMSPRQFRQEYEGSFETAGGKIYDDYGDDNQTEEVIGKNEQLYWCHDFNYTPLSSCVAVVRDGDFFILDEIILTSAVARQTAQEFIERYKAHKNRDLLLFGDPSGKAGEKHGHPSDYTEIVKVLEGAGWEVTRQIRAAAPAIRDRQNAVRAKICNAEGAVSLFVNRQKAPYCHKGLSTVQTKTGSTFLEVDGEYQHITTAIGYCIERLWPMRFDPPEDIRPPRPSLNYYGGKL
jgi:hypothetical protein